MSAQARLSFAVLEEAAHWFALLRSGAASAEDQAGWQCWIDAAAEHRIAWSQVDAISRRFETFQSPPERSAAAAVLSAKARNPSRRQVLAGLLATTGAGLLGWTALERGVVPESLLARLADYRTRVGEIRRFTLAEGVVVWLNTDSALKRVAPGRLRLLGGEILVEPDPAGVSSSLVVEAGDVCLGGEGARFAVRWNGEAGYVSVFAGALDIRAAEGAPGRRLERGRALSFDRSGLGGERPASPARSAWTRGVLLAEDLPLRELIRELGRYRAGHLAVAPEVAELRVIGGYPLHDTDQVLAMLEQSLPIRVRRVLPWWTTIEARA